MKLIYLHIGKTGGTSIRAVLVTWFKDCYPVPTEINTPTIKAAHEGFDYELAQRCDLVYGHFDWSIVSGLKGFQIMTMLRDPVERLYSQYAHYRRRVPSNEWTKPVAGLMYALRTFDDFVRYPVVLQKYRNYQARILSGSMWGTVGSDPIENLKRVDYLSIYPDFSAVERVGQALGKKLTLPRKNRSKHKEPIHEETKQYILRENARDVQLIESASGIIHDAS